MGATFGWAPLHYDTVKDILWNGQACATGLAIPIYDDTTLDRPNALCVNITKITTDQGTYLKPNTDVPQCLAANKGSYCSYHYNATHNFKTRCYCSADGSQGYCPLPSLNAMKTYKTFESYVKGNSTNCHTYDRDNLKAAVECGIGASDTL